MNGSIRTPERVPQLALVRVLTDGGPYLRGELLSLAFSSPTLGRLVPHEERSDAVPFDRSIQLADVPDSISVVVTHAAEPYVAGNVLTLSFVDPRVARIHPAASALDAAVTPTATATETPVTQPTTADETERPASIAAKTWQHAPIGLASQGEPPDDGATNGVTIRLAWRPERVRRFVSVVDKLFAVDRLGWYRHVFAMRLLVPDEVACGEAAADLEAMRHLLALRSTAVAALGQPLLAAFMPNFSVTPNWLDTLDSPAAARALAGLRDALLPHLADDATLDRHRYPSDPAWTTRTITRSELLATPAASIDACLPLFIATASPIPDLFGPLDAYRRALVDLFAQTARSEEAVRLNGMTQPNCALDDRLWQLVGAVDTAFDAAAAV